MENFMKTIQSLESSELIKRTQALVASERKTTMELIEHLREIDRRFLYLEWEYKSLFEFTTKHLGLSEGSAQRRIAAMRLIRDIPEAKKKLESGEITLSNASQVQTVFRTGKMSIEEKKETLHKISGMTQKECQSALFSLVPEAAPKLLERDRQIGAENFELKLVVSKELHDQIEELKLLLSHTLQSSTTSEFLKYLVGEELKRQMKKRGLSQLPISSNIEEKDPEIDSRGDRTATISENSISITTSAAPVQNETIRSGKTPVTLSRKHPEKRIRKHISNSTRREIWKRAGGCCEAEDLMGRCSSRYQLELDHIVPYAMGGTDDLKNLRLFCRAHNLRHAVESYGTELMSHYRVHYRVSS
jgi:5-methylcytosine-specific restriction endonuclease McrA